MVAYCSVLIRQVRDQQDVYETPDVRKEQPALTVCSLTHSFWIRSGMILLLIIVSPHSQPTATHCDCEHSGGSGKRVDRSGSAVCRCRAGPLSPDLRRHSSGRCSTVPLDPCALHGHGVARKGFTLLWASQPTGGQGKHHVGPDVMYKKRHQETLSTDTEI